MPSRATLAVLALSQLVVAIDYNIVLVALPGIGSALRLDPSEEQWTITAYALAVGGGLLLGGRLADTRGRRRTLLAGFVLYLVGSVVAALSPDFVPLVIGRAVQGIGGAMVVPATLALISALFSPGAERHRALSVWSAAGAVGLALGAALGGVLTSAFGWTAVFWINVPLVAIVVIGTLRTIPRDEARPAGESRVPLDLPGALLAAGAAVALVLGLSEAPLAGWSSPVVLVALIAGVVLVALFVLRERRAASALLPLSVLRGTTTPRALVVMLLFLGSIGASYVVFTLYTQNVLGLSALVTGLLYLPWGATAIFGSRLARAALGRLGIRGSLVLSAAIAALGTAGMAATLRPEVPVALVVVSTIVLGSGQAMGFAALFAAATVDSEPSAHGVASALMSTVQQLGTAGGIALLGALATAIAAGRPDGPAGTAAGLSIATWVGAAVLVAAVGVAATVGVARRRGPRRTDVTPTRS